jgi:hypothetical protein
MKALTILQPWASLIAIGAKQIETRSWPTNYRGPLAIHAGKRIDLEITRQRLNDAGLVIVQDVPLGFVIAIADLVDCVEVKHQYCDRISGTTKLIILPFKAELSTSKIIKGNELALGDYTPGRYAWILANVRRIDPVPAKGKQRLWEWESEQDGTD